MTGDISYRLKKIKQTHFLIRSGEVLLWASGVGLISYSILNLLLEHRELSMSIATGLTALAILIGIFHLRIPQLNDRTLLRLLNRQNPEFQESADLLVAAEHSLTPLQQIQRQRVIKQFDQVQRPVRFPNRMSSAILFILLSIPVAWLISQIDRDIVGINLTSAPGERDLGEQQTTRIPGIENLEISVSPPAYTDRKSFVTSDANLKVLESSTAAWSLKFSEKPKVVRMIFTGSDTVPLTRKQDGYVTSRSFQTSDIYYISWTDSANNVHSSDYFRVEVGEDLAPVIRPNEIPQHTRLSLDDKLLFEIRAQLADDYGLTDGYLIATVSKGSGESVKFREEKMTFTRPKKISGKNATVSRLIDLKQLGLDPGDELYFYIEALDSRRPTRNRTRTETYFIELQDTTSQLITMEGGLGVDVMPEYFRSQRQIIIDSEKLLRDRATLAKAEFTEQSNALGNDQKLLRLKYGQFLGEEFESGAGPDTHNGDTHGNEEEKVPEVTEEFGHNHNGNNEHNHLPESPSNHGPEAAEQEEDPLKAYAHVHDNPEEATFFTQSIRSKLKAALGFMWDAELHLRLADPGKSLPFQYKALRLLKEISNDSRIYVHRTGFDPPPLKEEKRLTGELAEIRPGRTQEKISSTPLFPAIRQALTLTEILLRKDSIRLSENEMVILQNAGNEFSKLAVEAPGKYLETLSTLKAIRERSLSDNELRKGLYDVRAACWDVLPPALPTPGTQREGYHKLDQVFLNNLEESDND